MTKVFKNLSAEDIRDSAHEFADEIKKAQIIMFPGEMCIRDRYSASLCKEAFLKVRRLVEKVAKRLASALARCNKNFLELKKICEDVIVLDSIGAVTMALIHLLHKPSDVYKRQAYAVAGESNARETGWALRALTALYIETGEEKYRIKCDKRCV